jgi:Putative bacterial sensory transduction regulator
MDITPLLTLETIGMYLKRQDVNFEMENNNGNRFLRTNWKFEMGDGACIISLNDGQDGTSRLEITCVTHNQYRSRRGEVIQFLNERNRARAFSRSMDDDGNVFLEYIAFYPLGMALSEDLFKTIFGGVLVHFQDDYAFLEGVQPKIEA